MSLFQIRQKKTGAVLWTGKAESEKTALDAMARAVGYPDYASLPTEIRLGGLDTEKLDLIS